MTVPRLLGLRTVPGGLRLVQQPVSALAGLRGARFAWSGQNLQALNAALRSKASTTYELQSAITLGDARRVEWKLLASDGAWTSVGYDKAKIELYVDRTHSGNTAFSKDFPARIIAPLEAPAGLLKLRILVDRSTVEVFAQDGLVAMTALAYPPAGANGIGLITEGPAPRRTEVELWPLGSAWRH